MNNLLLSLFAKMGCSRQYLGSIGKIDNGIVSVNTYGVYENLTFPLIFKVFKPKETLKTGAGVFMPSSQRVRANKWCKFERRFSNQTSEIRYVREIIFGKRRKRTYWEITTDPETMPPNSTSFVMTNLPGKTSQIKKILGNLYGLRIGREYGFRQCKQELGWTDYRLTKFEQIEKWWEIIFSAYWMISSLSELFSTLNKSPTLSVCNTPSQEIVKDFSRHQQWSNQGGWKTSLNNLRLIIQPLLVLCLIVPRARHFS